VHSTNAGNYVVSDVGERYNVNYTKVLRYFVDVRHKVLNLHKELSAPELFILENKLEALVAAWDEKYAQYQARQRLEASKEEAEDLTAEAIDQLESLKGILAHTLNINDAVDWERLKDYSAPPKPAQFQAKAFPYAQPQPHLKTKPSYIAPKISFFDVISGRKTRKLQEAQAAFEEAVRAWERDAKTQRENHAIALARWKEQKAAHDADQERKRAEHVAEQARLRDEFLAEQAARNAKIDELRVALERGEPEAVIEHSSMVLDASDYNGLFEKSVLIQYHPENKLLKIAYDLPAPDTLPALKAVRFVKATGELKETYITEREKKANFESVVYQVALRTLHELFESDVHDNITKVLFNGYVNFIDKSTGQEVRSCLLSVVVDKATFEAIDLSRVDPRACFKSLKGVSAASLASLTPIPPVIDMDREDRRFVEGRDVGSMISEETNLASMSWEDFEHLVRELFEKEFAARGGEVKITQASSDGGVDAVAFDPDPITGGKIVIQAKRYTRTVGVSAVRDLYGTLMNEGAAKGILVTTADYGPDAYQFASGKPITLMNGANLLHLLERHGYRARIDVREARIAMAGNNV